MFFQKMSFFAFFAEIESEKMFFEKTAFSILIISLVIFDLQKCTIPQIKALNILF